MEVQDILNQKKIVPTRGRVQTTDHPPIYPVRGATKRNLRGDRWIIYELIVRRFLATLAPSALLLENEAIISINDERFIAKGTSLLDPGWRKYYPYYKRRESKLPELEIGQILEILRVSILDKKTTPPPKYTEASLIKEMDKLGLGTKSTRHEIIQKLYNRGYVNQSPPVPTETGIALTSALETLAILRRCRPRPPSPWPPSKGHGRCTWGTSLARWNPASGPTLRSSN